MIILSLLLPFLPSGLYYVLAAGAVKSRRTGRLYLALLLSIALQLVITVLSMLLFISAFTAEEGSCLTAVAGIPAVSLLIALVFMGGITGSARRRLRDGGKNDLLV